RAPAAAARFSWLAVVCAAIVLNSQLLVPFQQHSAEQLVEARATFAWDYLYGGQGERQALAAAPGVPPVIWYMDDALTSGGDKVYDDCLLVQFYLYSRVELYNGSFYDSPKHLDGWTLASPDALRHLVAAKVTHVVTCQRR